ncbi:MAG: hypothetical protein K9J13_04885 [Saprospiraceae bacterium]|nr:hypothetical protein [Saprospiraceae bacterium]
MSIDKISEKDLFNQTILFQNIFDQLIGKQRKTLIAIACSNSKTELYSTETKKNYHLPASSTLTISLKSLMKKDLINKDNNTYKINNPVFKGVANKFKY